MCAKTINAQEKSTGFSADNPCAKYTRTPKLRLSSSYGKLKYDFQHSSSQLRRMSSKKNHPQESGTFMSGLSLIDMDWSVSMSVITKTIDDYKCIVPAAVDVFIGYRNPTIYISNDVARNSCVYNVVMRHEQQHQQINIAVLDHYLPMLKQGFQEKLSELQAIPLEEGKRVSDMTDELNFEYAESIRPLVNRFQITLQLEQQNLDTRENYENESNICE